MSTDNNMKDVYDEDLELLASVNLQVKSNMHDIMLDWPQRRNLCIIQLICFIIRAISLFQWQSRILYGSIEYRDANRDRMRHELMEQLVRIDRCRNIIRMGPQAFIQLCEKLRGTGRLKDSKCATVEEQVARFLYILSHNVRLRVISFFFHRSGETISRHFHEVLHAVISLESEFLQQPSGNEVPRPIQQNMRFYPYFKNCIGAMDGTHIRVKVPRNDATRFRGRKQWPTQNVLAACDFNMNFTYVLAGWEGTAADSRILKDALTREEKLSIPRGKFYLGDGGFPLRSGLLTPYRGVRYHLKEYSNRGPQNSKEIFNHRHASLRNVVERAFGVVKKRFPIIAGGTEPNYSFKTMTRIVIASCILHNFLMQVDPDDDLIAEVDRELQAQDTDNLDSRITHNQDEEYRQGSMLRDNIANHMWVDYESSLHL